MSNKIVLFTGLMVGLFYYLSGCAPTPLPPPAIAAAPATQPASPAAYPSAPECKCPETPTVKAVKLPTSVILRMIALLEDRKFSRAKRTAEENIPDPEVRQLAMEVAVMEVAGSYAEAGNCQPIEELRDNFQDISSLLPRRCEPKSEPKAEPPAESGRVRSPPGFWPSELTHPDEPEPPKKKGGKKKK